MLLDLQNVSKSYRNGSETVHALAEATLSLEVGDFTAVQGPSGCGKTTLLLVAGGLLSPDSGTITIGGENPYALAADRRAAFRAENVGFVFQQFHLVPYLSVLENVLTAAVPTRLPDARNRAQELLERFGLQHRAHHRPGQLSTGEKQRTALARALLNRPKLLLADEPTGNLDRENADIVLRHLAEFARERQEGAVLLVTHDRGAWSRAGRVLAISDGRLSREEEPVDVKA